MGKSIGLIIGVVAGLAVFVLLPFFWTNIFIKRGYIIPKEKKKWVLILFFALIVAMVISIIYISKL